MSQGDANARQLRIDAANHQAILLRASAGYLSDLVRRELWRMKEQPAKTWQGYTPKEVAEAIRIALRENHYNMQGFLPKKPGDYRYDPETGEFRIVLRHRYTTHTMLLKGQKADKAWLGLIVPYSRPREGMDLFNDYAAWIADPTWEALSSGVHWEEGWLLATEDESRCLWEGQDGSPLAPAMRIMPEWHRGNAQGIFLLRR
jgi:hypothetical protein